MASILAALARYHGLIQSWRRIVGGALTPMA